MPTKAELVRAIGSVLSAAGASYATAGARDKHYGVWIFSLVFDEAKASSGAVLIDLRSTQAVFRGNPSDLESPSVFTYAEARGATRDWEVHVDVNILGGSGVTHGVDVSLIPRSTVDKARREGRQPKLGQRGLGIEAKCFAVPLTPNEGRVVLGFQVDLASAFWLVSNKANDAVETMLRHPNKSTDFFGDAAPGSESEGDFRRAVLAHLNR
jgi:hypothetical protein